MKSIKSFFKNLWKDESGQGTAEYVLLLVVVIAVVFLFKKKLISIVESKTTQVGDGMNAIGTDTN